MTHSIIQADAIDFLRAQPADSVDLIFGSPPYEEARLYLEKGVNLGVARKTEDWVAWMVHVYTECQRVCRGLVAFVVAGQTSDFRWSAGPALLAADLHRAGFNLRNPPLYVREGIPGSGSVDWFKSKYEWIICTSRPGKLPWSNNTACGEKPIYDRGGKMANRLKDGKRAFTGQTHRGSNGKRRSPNEVDLGRPLPDLANPGNLIDCGANTHFGMGNDSEAPFPEMLPEFFILSCCPENGIVCDPFSGSGTTAAVSVRHGRNFIGCDLRQSQVELGMKRVATETPLALFQ